MPKPKPLPIDSSEERLADEFMAELEKVAARVAAEEGTPPSARLSEREAATYWGLRDPLVDPEQFRDMLVTRGIPPEALRHLRLARTYPDLLEAYQQPVQDPELAEQLATLAEYPYRAPLVFDHSDDDEERIARSDALDRAHQRLVAERMAQPATPPPGGMPEEGGPTDAR